MQIFGNQSFMMVRMLVVHYHYLVGRHWRVTNKLSEELKYKFFARARTDLIREPEIFSVNLRSVVASA